MSVKHGTAGQGPLKRVGSRDPGPSLSVLRRNHRVRRRHRAEHDEDMCSVIVALARSEVRSLLRRSTGTRRRKDRPGDL